MIRGLLETQLWRETGNREEKKRKFIRDMLVHKGQERESINR